MTRLVWWANPTLIFPAIVLGTCFVTLLLPESTYDFWGTEKYFDLWMMIVAVAAVCAFSVGSLAGSFLPTFELMPQDRRTHTVLGLLADLAFVFTLFGYVTWAYFAMQRGLSLSALLELVLQPEAGAADRMRESMKTVSGVTTFTQFGPVCVVLTCIQLFSDQYRSAWRFWFYIFALLGLAFLRSIVNSERLALIELMVPAVFMFVLLSQVCARGFFKWMVSIGPFFAIAGVLVIFGLFEYFRSWQYYKTEFDSFGVFVVSRIASYFCTALNNSVLTFYVGELPPWPYFTLTFFWRFPLIANSNYSYYRLTGHDPEDAYMGNLEMFGTQELNNHSGLFAPLIDYGYAGFFVFWLAYGVMSGVLTRLVKERRLAGLIFFPFLLVAILETPRIPYLTSHRTFPSIAFGLACLVAVNLFQSRKR